MKNSRKLIYISPKCKGSYQHLMLAGILDGDYGDYKKTIHYILKTNQAYQILVLGLSVANHHDEQLYFILNNNNFIIIIMGDRWW